MFLCHLPVKDTIFHLFVLREPHFGRCEQVRYRSPRERRGWAGSHCWGHSRPGSPSHSCRHLRDGQLRARSLHRKGSRSHQTPLQHRSEDCPPPRVSLVPTRAGSSHSKYWGLRACARARTHTHIPLLQTLSSSVY